MRSSDFHRGLANGVPICLGYLSVSFAFGISTFNSGLSVVQTTLISMFCVTSAGQLAAVPIMLAGGTLLEMALAQLVINLRYTLMSVSISQKLDDGVTLPHRLMLSYVVTDETFAMTTAQRGKISRQYFYGLILLPWLGWTLGTFLGAVAGNLLPPLLTASLGIAIYGMFIAIVVPQAKHERPAALCALIAVGLSCLFRYVPLLSRVPEGFVIILCATAASAILAVHAPVNPEGGN